MEKFFTKFGKSFFGVFEGRKMYVCEEDHEEGMLSVDPS